MSEKLCGPAEVNSIAGQLNAGKGEDANRALTQCTMKLFGESQYADYMKDHKQEVLTDDKAFNFAQGLFDHMASDLRDFYKSVASAAKAQTPDGLCKLSITESKDTAPYQSVSGDKCDYKPVAIQLDFSGEKK